MTAAAFAERVERVRRRGHTYTAVCPACRRPTLSFTDGPDGLRARCHCGCRPAEIAAALGLTLAELTEGRT